MNPLKVIMKDNRKIFFDLGGALINMTGAASAGHNAILTEIISNYDLDRGINFLKEIYMNHWEIIRKIDPRKMIYPIKLEKTVIKILNQLKLKYDHTLVKKCVDNYYEVGISNCVLFPDTIDCLESLNEEGYVLGVITNASTRWGRGVIRQHKLEGYFKSIIVSDEVGFEKPHPKIFKEALQSLNCRPDESMMIGDTCRADIKGANNLGMISVWLARPGYEKDILRRPNSSSERPNYIITSLSPLF